MMGAQQMMAKLPPETKQLALRVATAARAILASKDQSQSVTTMAAQGADGLSQATLSIMSILGQKMQFSRDDAPIAAIIVLFVIMDFMSKVGKVPQDPKFLLQAMSGVMAPIAKQYGASPQDIQDLDQVAPGLAQATQERMQQGGMLGQPQPGQPPAPGDEQAEPADGAAEEQVE